MPAGNPDGGQWTDGDGGRDDAQAQADAARPARPRVIIDTTHLGNGLSDAEREEIEGLNLISLKPQERGPRGVQLAGDPPEGLGGPSEQPPEIPKERPTKSWERTAVQRALSGWLVRESIVGEAAIGVIRSAEWLRAYEDAIIAGGDPPKTLEELQSDLSPKPGYDKHHIVEKTWAQYWGFTKDDTEDPSNLVMIPRLKHYQITGWYGSPNDNYGGLSPREYLSDKGWEERREAGLHALRLFEILQP